MLDALRGGIYLALSTVRKNGLPRGAAVQLHLPDQRLPVAATGADVYPGMRGPRHAVDASTMIAELGQRAARDAYVKNDELKCASHITEKRLSIYLARLVCDGGEVRRITLIPRNAVERSLLGILV